MKSLQARMVWSYLLLIVLVVCVLGGAFAALMWNYYYGGAQSSVKQRARVGTDTAQPFIIFTNGEGSGRLYAAIYG